MSGVLSKRKLIKCLQDAQALLDKYGRCKDPAKCRDGLLPMVALGLTVFHHSLKAELAEELRKGEYNSAWGAIEEHEQRRNMKKYADHLRTIEQSLAFYLNGGYKVTDPSNIPSDAIKLLQNGRG